MSNISTPQTHYTRYWTYKSKPGSAPWPDEIGGKNLTSTSYRNGSEDRHWRSKVRSHVDATGELTAMQYRIHRVYGYASYLHIPYNRTYYVHGDMHQQGAIQFPSWDSSVFDYVRGYAVARMLAAARKKQQGFSSGVFTGELRETIQMLRSPLKGVRDLLRKSHEKHVRRVVLAKRGRYWAGNRRKVGARPGRPGDPIRDLGIAASDTWLEFSFGLSPLISDIEDILHTLTRPMHIYKRVSGRASADVGVASRPGVFTFTSIGRVNTSRQVRTLYTARARGEVGFSKSASERRANDWGLISSQFVPTIYQLIPYSWLVDYFVNLGEIVDAYSAGVVPLTWSNVTTRVRAITVLTSPFLDQSDQNLRLTGASTGMLTLETKRVQRTSNIGSGIPPVSWSFPSGVRQLTNMVALAITRFV